MLANLDETIKIDNAKSLLLSLLSNDDNKTVRILDGLELCDFMAYFCGSYQGRNLGFFRSKGNNCYVQFW